MEQTGKGAVLYFFFFVRFVQAASNQFIDLSSADYPTTYFQLNSVRSIQTRSTKKGPQSAKPKMRLSYGLRLGMLSCPCHSTLILILWSYVQQMKDEAGVGSIDCQKYRWFCQEQGVNSYPTIRLYPHNSQGGYRYVYVHKEFFIILVFQCFHGQRKDRER